MSDTVSTEISRSIAQAFMSALNERRFDDMADLFAPGAMWTIDGRADRCSWGKPSPGRDIVNMAKAFLSRFDNWEIRIVNVIAENDKVAVESYGHGKGPGELEYKNSYLYRFTVASEGKISDFKEWFDAYEVEAGHESMKKYEESKLPSEQGNVFEEYSVSEVGILWASFPPDLDSKAHVPTVIRSQMNLHFDATYDVVVVGSGGAALMAAATAAKKHGLSVLVTEKSRWFGGTTAFSGGGAWIPSNHCQPSLGFSDSKELADTYIRTVVGDDLYDGPTVNSFLDNAPKMARWVEEHTALKWMGSPMVDFYSSEKGAVPGRMILARSFDGRKLGRTVRDLRYTLQGLKAFDSMQVSMEELPIMTHPFSNFGNFSHVVGKLLRYWSDKIRYGKGTFLANGNAMIGSLIYTLQQSKGELWNDAPATKIIMEGSRATGAVIHRNGQGRVRVRASKGIVLASGGFGRSAEARSYVPHEYCVSPSSDTGDGIRIAIDAGAVLPKPSRDNAIYAPVSFYRPSTGPVRLFPHFGQDRGKPGSIIVDSNGRRFISENEGYHQFGQKMHASKMDHCHLIVDRQMLRKYGVGFQPAGPYPLSRTLLQRYFVSAPSISELAEKIGVPADNLTATVQRYNDYAARGEDPDFHRGERTWDNMFGDPENKPNPNLRPCKEGPFYSVRLYPGNVSTLYGLKTNEYAQALDKYGKPIEGLYAAGNDNNSIWRGAYPGGGSCIGPGIVFGYVAANHLASSNDS